MFFKQLFDPASSTLTYLIADDSNHEAVLIDPVTEQVERDVRLLREHGLALKYTLETHVHADHVTAAHVLKQATGARTAVCRDCNAQGYDRLLKDGDVILFGHEEILTIATPGHTPGSVSYLWRDRVFTGDTLLIAGCGRTDCHNRSAQTLWARPESISWTCAHPTSSTPLEFPVRSTFPSIRSSPRRCSRPWTRTIRFMWCARPARAASLPQRSCVRRDSGASCMWTAAPTPGRWRDCQSREAVRRASETA